jgi:hypothetical protein
MIDAGLIACGVIVGLSHVYLSSSVSLGSAFTTAILGWGINLLILGFTAKKASLGNHLYHNNQTVVASQYLVCSIEVLQSKNLHSGYCPRVLQLGMRLG